ncbi:optineurin-like [Chlamydotis macqueenii]
MENGTDSMAASALSTYTPEEMVQQMKELITESNELKEAMKLHNQAMKDRYEELSVCREKQKEEREFYELKLKEVKQRLLDKCMENEKLQQHLQNLKEREGAEMEGCMAPEKEMRQLISQVHQLQAEKANMLGIISELQVKLTISAEDSFVETGMNEGEINRTAKEHQENSGEMTSNIDIYGRSKTADESKNLQSEELIVSQLLYCLRNETRKREELEKELQNHKERLSKLEKKTSNCLKSGTQTEEQAEESSEAVGSEVETLSLQVCALFKELQEAHEKVKEAELIQKQLQEKCQVLGRKSSAAASELEEKQQLIYTIKKLELQVESMQAEVKLEQAKAHEEKATYSSLQDTNSKLLPELTKAMKTIDEMKLKELHRADKVVVEQLNAKVELAEQVPAAKQLQIDEMKQIIANYLGWGPGQYWFQDHKGSSQNDQLLRAPLTEFIQWMQKKGLINKPGEMMETARLQAAGKELQKEGKVGTRGVVTRLQTLGSVKRLLAKAPFKDSKGMVEFGCILPRIMLSLPEEPELKKQPPKYEDTEVPSVSPSAPSTPPFTQLASNVEVEGSAQKVEAAAEKGMTRGFTDWTLIARNCVLEGVSLGPPDGDGGIMVCPVTQGQEGRHWSPLDYKLLREWQKVVKEEGVNGANMRGRDINAAVRAA